MKIHLSTCILLGIFLSHIMACKPKKLSNSNDDFTQTTTYRSRGDLNKSIEEKFNSGYEKYQKDSTKYIIKHHNKDTQAYSNTINIAIKVNSFHYNHLKIKDVQTKFVDLDKETGLINFNDIMGFKFYRFISDEYGKTYNYIKYDIFLNQNGYWVRIGENPYQLVVPLKKEAADSGNYLYSVSTASDIENYDYNIGYFEK